MAATFLEACGLPERWQQRERFTVLDTGFGDGRNFITTWQSWRDDPLRCERLTFIAIDAQPLSLADLHAVHTDPVHADPVHADRDHAELAALIRNAWPPLTRNLHDLRFDGGRVRLLLALGSAAGGRLLSLDDLIAELVAQVDAFHVDDPETPPKAPHEQATWRPRTAQSLARLAAPGATLTIFGAGKVLRASLVTAGFELGPPASDAEAAPIMLARHAPRFTARRMPVRQAAPPRAPKQALVIGAGLAGCATAWALAEQGWHSRVIERNPWPANEASGNAAGLFHGIVNPHDGVHARFNRAAALAAREAVSQAIRHHKVSGATHGLLRTETERDPAQMQALIDALGLPADYVQALPAGDASAMADLALAQPAWFYPGGGWVHPAGLARSFIERAGAMTSLRVDTPVHALQRSADGWELHDAAGHVIDTAPVVVLANANDALRLLGHPDWPVRRVRGQVSGWPEGTRPSPPVCRVPVAGSGYLLPPFEGTVWFGATSQPGDGDPTVRDADHAANLAQLRRLTGEPLAAAPTGSHAKWLGRTGWRCSANDRLPIIGAVPDASVLEPGSPDQARRVPRVPGLYVFTALGSRGITWSALGARVLAALVAGAPVPLEARLLDAVDPARFAVRARRRSTRDGG